MPITKSAEKALRQAKKRRIENSLKTESYKTAAKKFKKLVGEGKREEATTLLADVYKKLDKAAKLNIIHTNKAARLKSRLSKKLAQPSASHKGS